MMLLSDSYIGLDQSYVIDLSRVNKRLEANVKVAKKVEKKVVTAEYTKDDVYSKPTVRENVSEDSDDGFCRYN